MATYATQADFEGYVEGWQTTDAAALERLLKRAERDIDELLGNRIVLASGLKLDPLTLEDYERAALKRAVCAQAEWRFVAGEAALRGGAGAAQLKSVKGPDFEKTYAVPDGSAQRRRFGPKVRGELAPITHLRVRGGRAVA